MTLSTTLAATKAVDEAMGSDEELAAALTVEPLKPAPVPDDLTDFMRGKLAVANDVLQKTKAMLQAEIEDRQRKLAQVERCLRAHSLAIEDLDKSGGLSAPYNGPVPSAALHKPWTPKEPTNRDGDHA